MTNETISFVDFTSNGDSINRSLSFRAYFPLHGNHHTVCIMRMLWNGKPQGINWDGVAIRNPHDEYNTHIGRRVAAKKAIENFVSFYHDSHYSKSFKDMVKNLNAAFRKAYREKFQFADGGAIVDITFVMGEL